VRKKIGKKTKQGEEEKIDEGFGKKGDWLRFDEGGGKKKKKKLVTCPQIPKRR